MRKPFRWVKSLIICVIVLALLGMVGYTQMLELPESQSQHDSVQENSYRENRTLAAEIDDSEESDNAVTAESDPETAEETDETAAAEQDSAQAPQSTAAVSESTPPAPTANEPAPAAASAPPENSSPEPTNENDITPVGTPDPAPVPEPDPEPAPTPAPEPAPAQPAPVSYSWGGAQTFNFRSEVHVTNTGSELSQGVVIHLPMLENSSPYQTTALQSTNYSQIATNGRVGSFNIGDLQPGETKTLTTDYTITVRPVSLNSTNPVIDKARQAYSQYAGSGNCYTLASGFVTKCREMGLTARVVNGFTRPQRSNMTAGSLEGCRHSWAEFYVDGLGWVPVDLTFEYFGNFPYASHIVETYADLSIRVNYLGSTLSVSWQNRVL